MEFQDGTSELTLTRYVDSADQGLGSRITTRRGRSERDQKRGEADGSSETLIVRDRIAYISRSPLLFMNVLLAYVIEIERIDPNLPRVYPLHTWTLR